MNTENDFLLKQKNKIWTVHPRIHTIGAIGNALSIETDLGIIQVDTGMTRKMARE